MPEECRWLAGNYKVVTYYEISHTYVQWYRLAL
jgi:hypothetical protein